MDPSLPEILSRCMKQDEKAVDVLVARFAPWALRFAESIAQDDDLAQDAVQESFITALRRLADLRDPLAFPAWFRQILRTEVNRILRCRVESCGADLEDVVSDQPSAKDRLERKEVQDRVRRAVAVLPPQSRKTVEAFYFEERSISEVANAFGIPQGTVKRRLHDARHRLRNMLLGEPDLISPKEKP